MYARLVLLLAVSGTLLTFALARPPARLEDASFAGKLNVKIPSIASDRTVRYDYDIVYVRGKRSGDKIHKRFYTDIATPVTLEPGADLMLLKPDGKEEVLVRGGEGAVTDPVVSFDGQWVFYTLIHSMKGAGPWQPPPAGADIYKIHVPTRRIVRLTHQQFTPNTGAADWSSDCRTPEKNRTHLSYGVLNFGAYPLPGGRLVFTSNRNAFRPPRGYPRIALQLFVMDDDGKNVEQIGYLNLAGALHPVVLRDGRILFSSLENQGIRGDILWGIWSIHPDGTNWAPLVSAFDPGGAPNAYHFQTQLSDGSIVIEGYYNQNNSGFGTYIKLPEKQPSPGFGPAHMHDPRNRPWRFGRHDNGRGRWYRMPFMPVGAEVLTPFARIDDGPADRSDLADKTSPRVGKLTHPSGAPDNHLLTVYSPGPVNHQYTYLPQLDGGIYLLKGGKPIDEPGQLLLIKNDPEYNEQWPRALVPYRRIYGIDEPKTLTPWKNDGTRSPHLPEGTPFGLVGSSSLYKRESYPNGAVMPGSVTARYTGKNDPWRGLDAFTSHGNGMPLNWHNQGADAGLYPNDDIHAIRLLAMEPTTDRNRGPRSGRLFHSHAGERLRILGEIPVRKFAHGKQPVDPDGNPDTSFLARIPADVAFTFQTIDREGMVLNMSQTWHQLRPGEIRHDCGGCHAHSQAPTPFEKTEAGKKGYEIWDLVNTTPLVTGKKQDTSRKRWDEKEETGLRFAPGVQTIEYHRDVWPILERSCVACHTVQGGKPAGNLALDGPEERVDGTKVPGGYYRLALDARGKYGHRPVGYDSWGYPQASRYIRKFQSRRSLLVWKLYGKRLDGFSNDDHPSEPTPGAGTLAWKGKAVEVSKFRHRADIDHTGERMPPPAAVASGKVKPLSEEDRRTLVRWIDLGCPLDLDFDAKQPQRTGHGYAGDDNRPTLTLTMPAAGNNQDLPRILVGMHDYGSGLDVRSFHVAADFVVDNMPVGTNLAPWFRPCRQGVWELPLKKPLRHLPRGTLTVSVKDRQGNISTVVRTFSVGAKEDQTARLRAAVTLYASFDEAVKADRAGGVATPRTRYGSLKEKKFTFEKGYPKKAFRIAKDKGIHGGALECIDVLPDNGRIFFPAKGNLEYRRGGWSGAVSVWLQTDPNRLLKTSFCDPVQITQRGANDGGIWIDFNNAKPRDLRLGVFPAVRPGKKGIAESAADAPLVWRKKIDFQGKDWHHVVMNWRNLDTGKADAMAELYIDGKRIGAIQDRELAMAWDIDQTGIYIAVNYIGLLDELAVFGRHLSEAEIRLLHTRPGFLSTGGKP